MKRLAIATAVLVLGAATASPAHPGHGADSVTIAGDTFRYSPFRITVGVGDAVVWFWHGRVRNHSVTADPGQTEQFDSDPAGPPSSASHPEGSSFSHVFQNEGVFTYFCRTHANMRGEVEVVDLPPATAAPRLSDLRVSDGRGATARYRLSKRAQVVARIAERRKRGWRRVASFSRSGRSGQNRLGLGGEDLREGRHRLTLVAYDDADQRSNTVRATFTP